MPVSFVTSILCERFAEHLQWWVLLWKASAWKTESGGLELASLQGLLCILDSGTHLLLGGGEANRNSAPSSRGLWALHSTAASLLVLESASVRWQMSQEGIKKIHA